MDWPISVQVAAYSFSVLGATSCTSLDYSPSLGELRLPHELRFKKPLRRQPSAQRGIELATAALTIQLPSSVVFPHTHNPSRTTYLQPGNSGTRQAARRQQEMHRPWHAPTSCQLSNKQSLARVMVSCLDVAVGQKYVPKMEPW